jgi:hypothetical protein
MTFISNYPPVTESDIKGKPYVTVSAKGIANGLSDIPNDGADFGPDTTLNATDPSQIGSPYTYTSGIQEAINYVFNQGGGEILLGEGVFQLNATYVNQKNVTNGHVIEVPYNSPNNPIMTISIRGSAPPMDDYQTGYGAAPSITPTNMKRGSIIYNPTYLTSPPQSGSAIFGAAYQSFTAPSGAGLQNNVNIFLTDLTFTEPQPISGQPNLQNMVQLDNFAGFYLRNVVVNVYTPTGALYNPSNSPATGISINQPTNGNGLAVLDNVYVVNYYQGIWVHACEHLHIKHIFVQYCTYGLALDWIGYSSIIEFADLEQNTIPVIFNGGKVFWFYSAKFQIGNEGGAYSSTNWSSAQMIFCSANTGQVFGEIECFFSSDAPTYAPLTGAIGNGSVSNLYGLIIKQIESPTGAETYPLGSNGTTTAGTTAGSVIQQFVEFKPLYKKLLIQFSGYENNTTTNQTINFPLSFSSYAVITGNNTGLTITASTTGITITSPNSTTTYSGIVIVEGY